MIYRKFNTQDTDKLVALWQSVFPDDPPHNEPSSILKAKLKVDDLIYIVEQDDNLLGACMAGYDGHRGWLYAVAVNPDYRRQGIGQELIKFTLSELAKFGCIKVNLQIRSTNSAVAAFYESLGFEAEDRLSMGTFIGDSDTNR